MNEFLLILPEIFLAVTLAFVVAGEISYHGERVRLISWTALIGLAGAFVQTLISYQYGAAQVFGHSFSIDGLSLFFKLLFIFLGGLAVAASMHTREIPDSRKAEYAALVVASCLAMSLVASASDMLLAFLSLQFVNVLAYFLAAFGKRSVRSAEASIKYMIFSAVAGALLLYGLAILFSATHTMNVYDAHRALMSAALPRSTLLVAFVLVFMALAFQMGAFPMYLWTPDVLEGAPTPVSGFLAVGTRAAGFALAIRFLLVLFAQPTADPGRWQILGALDWPALTGLVAGLTLVIGTLLALMQRSAKRLVACLVVAQSGFLLLGILVLDEVGIAALLYNLVVEMLSLMGIYFVLSFIFDQVQSDRLKDLEGMLRRVVPECVCLLLFLLCLVGVPPFPGFIGKFTLIGVAIRHHHLMLACVAIGSMTLSTVAVSKLAYRLVGDFRSSDRGPLIAASASRAIYLGALVIPIALTGIFAEFVLGWAGRSLAFILW